MSESQITMEDYLATLKEVMANPKFVRFCPPLEKQLQNNFTRNRGIEWYGDVSNGCGQAFTYFLNKHD